MASGLWLNHLQIGVFALFVVEIFEYQEWIQELKEAEQLGGDLE